MSALRVRVPASSANLGPGFDALGMALSLHLEMGIDDGDAILFQVEQEGSACHTGEFTCFHREIYPAKDEIN